MHSSKTKRKLHRPPAELRSGFHGANIVTARKHDPVASPSLRTRPCAPLTMGVIEQDAQHTASYVYMMQHAEYNVHHTNTNAPRMT
jgi:hypothetical protein